MKGVIKPDHIPVNNYELIILGMPALTPVSVSGIEDETNTVDLPDKTSASGGTSEPVEFTVGIPMHHETEIAAMDIWLQEGRDPVSPLYKKAGSLIYKSISGNTLRSYSVIGVQNKKRTLPDAEMENEGDMAVVEYLLRADQILPI